MKRLALFHILLAFTLILAAAWLVDFAASDAPQVVVQMPVDAKPLGQLKPVEIKPDVRVFTGDRAVLYWTVFQHVLEKSDRIDWSTEAPERAVDKVYGPLPKTP